MKRLLACLTAFVLIFLISCEKKFSDADLVNTNQSGNLLMEAKQYFDTNLAYDSNKFARQDEAVNWRHIKQPQWGKATKVNVDGVDVVEVPLLVDGQEPVYTLDNPAFGEKGLIKKKTV